MSATPFLQWRYPQVQTDDGNLISFRINKGQQGYAGPATLTEIAVLGSINAVLISEANEFEIEKLKHDIDAELCAPKLELTLYDEFVVAGVDGAGTPFSYNLGASNSSLNEEIFFDLSETYELFVDSYDITGTLTEVWFCGDIDPNTITKGYITVTNEFSSTPHRLSVIKVTANFAVDRLQKATVQDLIDADTFNNPADDRNVIVVGGLAYGYENGNNCGFPRIYAQKIQCNFSPSNIPNLCSVISLDSIAKVIATSVGFDATASGIDSSSMMLDFYLQHFVNMSPGGFNWSTTVNGTWNLTQLTGTTWADVFVISNFLWGVAIKSTGGYDTTFVKWPITIDRTSSQAKLINWLASQTLTFFDSSIAIDGTPSFVLRPRRSGATPVSPIGDLSVGFGNYGNWQLTSTQEEPRSVSQSSLITQNLGDDLQLIAGPDAADAKSYTIPWRTHKYGSPVATPSNPFPAFVGSEINGTTNEEYFSGFDGAHQLIGGGLQVGSQDASFNAATNLPQELWWNKSRDPFQQLFTSQGTAENNENAFDPDVTKPATDGWILGSMLLWKNAATAQILPLNAPGGLNDSTTGAYYAIAAQAPAGVTLTANESADGYFDATQAHCQIYFQEIIGNKIVLKQEFIGCRGATGLLQDVRPGIRMQSYFRGSLRTFEAHSIKQKVKRAHCEIQWIEVIDYNGELPTVVQIAGSGSSSSSSSSSTSAGSNGNNAGTPTAASFVFLPKTVLTGTGNVVLPHLNITAYFNDAATTGALKPVAIPITGQFVQIVNNTGQDWTQASGSDFYISDKTSYLLQYLGDSTVYDPTLPAGYIRAGFSG